MQWDGGPFAGFSTVDPWLPLSADAATRNVDAMCDVPGSVLTLYRRLLGLRREHAALAIGSYCTVPTEPDTVFAYERSHAEATIRVILNFGDEAHDLILPEGSRWTLLLSSHSGRTGERAAGHVTLAGAEGLILLQT